MVDARCLFFSYLVTWISSVPRPTSRPLWQDKVRYNRLYKYLKVPTRPSLAPELTNDIEAASIMLPTTEQCYSYRLPSTVNPVTVSETNPQIPPGWADLLLQVSGISRPFMSFKVHLRLQALQLLQKILPYCRPKTEVALNRTGY